jgi:RimJ/RimL family protein N-acetyltransferase
MNIQPTLQAVLIELRPLKQQDYDALFKAASDPLIWEMHPQPDRYQPEVFKSFFAEAMDSKGALAIIDRKNSQIIGTSRYYDYSPKSASLAIGYTFLTRDYWGGTYNRELKKLMVNYALNFVKTTFFHVALGNIRSQKAMLKLGGINTGIQEIPLSYAPAKKSYVYKIEKPL